MKHFIKLCLIAAIGFGVGCGDDDGGTDSGLADTGTDATMPDTGADTSTPDGGDDAGTDAGDDAGADAAADAPMDVPVDAPPPEDGIPEVRAAADGTHDPALEVRGVTVTYLRPVIEGDPAGFFVQSVMAGPALFVAIDPATTDPVLAVGDVIDFDVTETVTTDDQHRVTAITGLLRSDTGTDVSGLVQDLSAATDVVSALGDYESELVSFSGTLTGDAGFAGTGHRSIQLVTAGVDDADLVFRSTEMVFTDNNLRDGCVVEIGPSPVWRRLTTAQAMGYVAGDLTVTSCPAIVGETPTAAGDLVITELVSTPTDGEFFEIHNPSTTVTYNLNGCTLYDSNRPGNDTVVTGSIQLDPGAYVVLSEDTETTPAGGLPFGLNDGGDTPGIECGSPAVTIDEVDYGAVGFPARTARVSIQLDPGSLTAADNDTGTNWCVTPAGNDYGTMSGVGTPAAANVACPAVGGPAELLFTEYVEGSGSNKALEITNIGTDPADMSMCEIRRWNNGRSPTDGAPTDTHSLAAAGTLAAGAVHVVCNTSGDAGLLAVCDEMDNGPTGFNGDDALELYCAGTLVDSFGQLGDDPGSEWTNAGMTVGTQNETLRRTNCTPDTTADDAFDPAVNFATFAEDTFDGLGTFTCP